MDAFEHFCDSCGVDLVYFLKTVFYISYAFKIMLFGYASQGLYCFPAYMEMFLTKLIPITKIHNHIKQEKASKKSPSLDFCMILAYTEHNIRIFVR
jgi:hypothetical protein